MPAWMKWMVSLLIGFGIIYVGFHFSWGGSWILKPFFVLNCLVLIIVVLLQSGKAADLAGAFGGAGSQTAFGPRGAATILSQATTWCAIMFMVCAMALVVRVDRAAGTGGSVIYNTTKPAATKPATTPATTPAPPPQNSTVPPSSAPGTQPPRQSTPQQQAPAPPPQNPKN